MGGSRQRPRHHSQCGGDLGKHSQFLNDGAPNTELLIFDRTSLILEEVRSTSQNEGVTPSEIDFSYLIEYKHIFNGGIPFSLLPGPHMQFVFFQKCFLIQLGSNRAAY